MEPHLQSAKRRNPASRFLYLVKISFRNESNIKSFSNKNGETLLPSVLDSVKCHRNFLKLKRNDHSEKTRDARSTEDH